jgi:hypothetical protein
LGIFEIILFLIVALIVIPPDDLPQVMRAVGKVLRELRLASNTVMREISGAIGDDSPFNILPPRFDEPVPPPTTPVSPAPPPAGFLAPEPRPQSLTEIAPPVEAAPRPPVSARDPKATGELVMPSDQPTVAEGQPAGRQRRPRNPKQPSARKRPAPPAEEP